MTNSIAEIRARAPHSHHAPEGNEQLLLRLCDVIETMRDALDIADDCLKQCADQGKMMPGEYDTFLEALAKLEGRVK
jgi:division protein CdvB (Snf7/Vps24/ESCRT-III family)